MRDRGIGGKVFVPCDRRGREVRTQCRSGKSWYRTKPMSRDHEDDFRGMLVCSSLSSS